MRLSALDISEATNVFGSLLLAERFLAPTNMIRPPFPPQANYQIAFIDLYFPSITLHELISCSGTCRVQLCLLILPLGLSLASSYYVLSLWFEPFLLSYEAVWWIAPEFLDFFKCVIHHPFRGISPWLYQYTIRAL